jgi:hypothetical protein
MVFPLGKNQSTVIYFHLGNSCQGSGIRGQQVAHPRFFKISSIPQIWVPHPFAFSAKGWETTNPNQLFLTPDPCSLLSHRNVPTGRNRTSGGISPAAITAMRGKTGSSQRLT